MRPTLAAIAFFSSALLSGCGADVAATAATSAGLQAAEAQSGAAQAEMARERIDAMQATIAQRPAALDAAMAPETP